MTSMLACLPGWQQQQHYLCIAQPAKEGAVDRPNARPFANQPLLPLASALTQPGRQEGRKAQPTACLPGRARSLLWLGKLLLLPWQAGRRAGGRALARAFLPFCLPAWVSALLPLAGCQRKEYKRESGSRSAISLAEAAKARGRLLINFFCKGHFDMESNTSACQPSSR